MHDQYESVVSSPLVHLLRRVGVLALLVLAGSVAMLVLINIVYAGRIFPGVRADGIQVGGLSREEAKVRLAAEIERFQGELLTLQSGDQILRIPVGKLGVEHDAATAANLAFSYGRQGTLGERLHAQLRALTGRDTIIGSFKLDQTQLATYLGPFIDDLSEPVNDATLVSEESSISVQPAAVGRRVNIGALSQLIDARVGTLDSADITVPVYEVKPAIETEPLQKEAERMRTALEGPITLAYADEQREVGTDTLKSWLVVQRTSAVRNLAPSFVVPAQVKVSIDEGAVKKYVANLASSIDQPGRNAVLTVADGKITVTDASRNGRKLDQVKARGQLVSVMNGSVDERRIDLALAEVKPEVREDNLEQLGIKERISQGVTYFPGSSASRIINVRTGASRYDGLLIKPGQVFSFNEFLGDVTAEAGFVQEKVIIGNKIEKQYGGGLCQVSSTAYRAALLAGLPILERHNHSYAVSYYTAPYNAPGLDATIYAPSVDMRFKNDTGSYILIQTRLEGTSLKFDFYGTKTKEGVIRGPEFVDGSNDAAKASQTVFYRDIKDLSGKVIKTDPVHTRYKPSGEFSTKPQYN